MLIENGEWALLEVMRDLRPKEYLLMTIDLKDLLKEFTPEQRNQVEAICAAG